MGALREIVDLNRQAAKGDGLKAHRLYVYDGKLWEVPQTGCVLCDAAGKEQTLRSVDDPDLSVCLQHGPLIATKLVERLTRTIEFGDTRKIRRARHTRVLLIPSSYSPPVRKAAIRGYKKWAAKGDTSG
jgi:hypothetical protein